MYNGLMDISRSFNNITIIITLTIFPLLTKMSKVPKVIPFSIADEYESLKGTLQYNRHKS